MYVGVQSQSCSNPPTTLFSGLTHGESGHQTLKFYISGFLVYAVNSTCYDSGSYSVSSRAKLIFSLKIVCARTVYKTTTNMSNNNNNMSKKYELSK